jgi:hypothetical protein
MRSRFDHGHEQRHEGHVMVTVRHDGRKAEVPLGGSRRRASCVRPVKSSGLIAPNCQAQRAEPKAMSSAGRRRSIRCSALAHYLQ